MPKRRADWLAGRIAAKAVVAAALREVVPGAWPPAAIEIASEASGVPYARLAPGAAPVQGLAPGDRLPASVTISHAEGHALCAATAIAAPAGGAPPRSLGIDLGVVEPRSTGFVGTFFTDEEQRFVAAPGGERDVRANLVWCAKEAVLKALGLGLTVDTVQLSCRPVAGRADPAEWPLAPADADGAWSPFVATLGPALSAWGPEVRGLWRTFGPFVGALAAVGGAPVERRRAVPVVVAIPQRPRRAGNRANR